MAYRDIPQPDPDCCLGGYCWRKFCPDRKAMRRWLVGEALRRDARAVARDVELEVRDVTETDD